jgi:hypothetical protein
MQECRIIAIEVGGEGSMDLAIAGCDLGKLEVARLKWSEDGRVIYSGIHFGIQVGLNQHLNRLTQTS